MYLWYLLSPMIWVLNAAATVGLVMILPFKELMTKCSLESKLTPYLFPARLVFWFACYCDIETVNADPWIELSTFWMYHGGVVMKIWKTLNSFVENAFNPIYSKNILPSPLFMSEHMKFGCNVSKDTWLKKKSKFPPFSKMQLGCNDACKKTLFSNMIIFFWVSLHVHTECNFMNVLILGSDHINLTPTSSSGY